MSAPAARPLPPVFDRMVVILTGQAHLFAVLVITVNWPAYRSGGAEIALLLGSLAVPLVALVVAQRSGGVLGRGGIAIAGLAVVAVDVGGAFSVRPAEIGGPAMWVWGAVGVTVLTLAPFRPVREIVLLGGVNGLVVVAVMGTARAAGHADAFRILADLNAAVLPALAAAQFVGLYIGTLRTRQAAAEQGAAARARTLAEEAVGADTERRLSWLRAEAVPLLEGVAAGTIPPSAPATAQLAQRLSRELRRELLEARTGLWLLGERPTDVLDPQRCLERLADGDRAALAVLVSALRENRQWERLSVALTTDGRPDVAAVTVVAAGPPAGQAAGDHVVSAAAARLRAAVDVESDDLLVADAEVALRATGEGIR